MATSFLTGSLTAGAAQPEAVSATPRGDDAVPVARGCTMMGRTKTPCRGAHSKYETPCPSRYQMPYMIYIYIYNVYNVYTLYISTDDVVGA